MPCWRAAVNANRWSGVVCGPIRTISRPRPNLAPLHPSLNAAVDYPQRRMRSFHVTTFGCQMNEHDSERMKGMLESLGYAEASTRDDADLILFNTCSIREKADNRLVGHLGEAKRLKSEDPTRVIGVGGCWSQSMKEK